MATAFKMAYSLVVAVLFVFFAVFGILTFYEEPRPPARRTKTAAEARGPEPLESLGSGLPAGRPAVL